MSMLPNTDDSARTRWLFAASIALNVLFMGAGAAVVVRYTGSIPLSNVALIDRSAADRLDRLAASLPPDDAQVMRDELSADEEQLAAAQADLRLSQEQVRDALRADPLDLDAVRAAMAQVQVARSSYHLVLHQMVESAVSRMSVVGRNKLADWRAMRDTLVVTQ